MHNLSKNLFIEAIRRARKPGENTRGWVKIWRTIVTVWLLMRLMFQLYKGKMRTIILTYPGFQSLPKGIKQMLIASENFYFEEVGSTAAKSSNFRPKDAKIAQFTSIMSLPLAAFAKA
jgi:hypothetical protein